MRKKLTKFALTAALVLAMAFTLSCSSDDGGGNPAPSGLRKEKISGVSQKGPFAQGATVKVYELNTSTGEKGNPLPFDVTTDGSGNFKIENVTLASQYIVIEVSGKYFNEVSNKQTTAPITLRAVADVSGKDNVNINVFTHLEYGKVLKLAKGGTEFGAAKKAAQKELLNALGMSEVGVSSEDLSLFGGSKSDSLLLATSVLLQANRSPTEVSSLLDAISGEIRDNGALSAQTKTQVASGLADLNGKVGQSVLNLANNIVAGMNGSSSSSSGGSSSSSSSGAGGLCAGFMEGTTREHYGKDKPQFCDPRDGKKYVYVTIGNQTWMAENLNYETGGKCFGDDPANCTIYGRLYDWATAISVCPTGWHLSSYADWDTLTTTVGSSKMGTKLKAASVWNTSTFPVGTDDYGFSALPGGHRVNGNLGIVGNGGGWWNPDEADNNHAFVKRILYDYEDLQTTEFSKRDDLLSVRCVKD